MRLLWTVSTSITCFSMQPLRTSFPKIEFIGEYMQQ
jgi:hypothetical protein